ncbi:hypothetical protein KI387_017579 [Taxus chinensis]|uniref:Uncharacterized protein n=1 Tax=Taxus chinensis TaxID=29808 RepID=A0AA38LHM1_TAXCH|nr:hypothetical protein KI387_017579 [Taxus chinensis]
MQSSSAKEAAREARRRKILQRGADRLAFISGDRKTIAPIESPAPSPPIEPAAYSIDQDQGRSVNGGFSAEIHDEPSVDIAGMNGSLSESLQYYSRTNSTPDFRVERESSSVISSDSFSLAHQAGDKKSLSSSSLFTVSRFIHAIDASENARALCAVGIAVLLVIHSFLLAIANPLGAILGRFVPPWPVYLLIVTDITLVMAIMLMASKSTNPIEATVHTFEENYPTSGVWKLANMKISLISMDLKELHDKMYKMSSVIHNENSNNTNARRMEMEKELLKMKGVIIQIKDAHILNVKSTIYHLKLLAEMIQSMELEKEKEKDGTGPKVVIKEPNYKSWKETIATLVKEWNNCKETVEDLIKD